MLRLAVLEPTSASGLLRTFACAAFCGAIFAGRVGTSSNHMIHLLAAALSSDTLNICRDSTFPALHPGGLSGGRSRSDAAPPLSNEVKHDLLKLAMKERITADMPSSSVGSHGQETNEGHGQQS